MVNRWAAGGRPRDREPGARRRRRTLPGVASLNPWNLLISTLTFRGPNHYAVGMYRRILGVLVVMAAVSALPSGSAVAQDCPPGTTNPNYCVNTGPSGPSGPSGTSGNTGNLPSVTLAPPIFGETADLDPVGGKVRIRLPGTSIWVLLSAAVNVPFGTIIDARHGKVTLTFALPHGGFETGTFFGGEFKLTQSANGTVILTLVGGSYAGCPAPPHQGTARLAAAHKKPKTVIRQLWGNAHGNYTTKGRYGSASVSGTKWLTQDRCDGTYVLVTKDNVFVVAYAHPHHKHNVHQGHHFLVPAPGYP